MTSKTLPLLLTLLLMFGGCEPSDELSPKVAYFPLQIISEETGKDWFQSTAYIPDSLQISKDGIYWHKLENKEFSFGVILNFYYGSTIYTYRDFFIDYGNGDIDTLLVNTITNELGNVNDNDVQFALNGQDTVFFDGNKESWVIIHTQFITEEHSQDEILIIKLMK